MKRSAGILLYRRTGAGLEVLLVHPGGPFWAGKDRHAWSMPKGHIDAGEEALAAARRELAEETGAKADAEAIDLGVLKAGDKEIHAFAIAGDWDPANLVSNTFALEWPPGSGAISTFPEVDRAAWFALAQAREKIHRGQARFLDALAARLEGGR